MVSSVNTSRFHKTPPCLRVLQAVTLSRDGQYVMVGGDSGVVEVWRAHDLQLLYSYPACDSSICSLALSHDHK